MEESPTGGTKSFLSSSFRVPIKQIKADHLRSFRYLRWGLILPVLLIISAWFLTWQYPEQYSTVRNDLQLVTAASSPDGQTIIVDVEKKTLHPQSATSDSTFLLLSHDRGVSWTQSYLPEFDEIGIDVSFNGDCLGADQLLRSKAIKGGSFDSTFDESFDRNTRQATTNGFSRLWLSRNFGQTREVVDSVEGVVNKIIRDRTTGNWLIKLENRNVYVYNAQRKLTKMDNSKDSLFKIEPVDTKDVLIRLGTNRIDLLSHCDSTGQKCVGSVETANLLFLTEDNWKSWRSILPIVKTPRSKSIQTTIVLFEIGAFVSAVILIALLFMLTYRYRRIKKLKEDNLLAMLSDNPSTEDKLGFKSTKEAVTALLRNPDSKPPISIAINGRWGSGKSSLMTQIQKDLLDDDRFVTMWFNVWHFQSEDHMLASFLSSILQTFEKSFGFRFRARLFGNKLLRLPFSNRVILYTGLFIVVPFLLYLFLQLYPFSLIQPVLNSFSLTNSYLTGMDSIKFMLVEMFNSDPKKASDYAIPIFSVITWIAGIFFLKKEWMPSGLSSFFQLIPIEKFRMEAVKEDPGFREKYKREFWEILEAAGDNKRYVVFIDDMDRIDGKRLKDLLEGINFISDTASRPSNLVDAKANIVFVLGMSMEEVVFNLGKELKPNAKEPEQKIYGASFMQKLVDLVVQVPSVDLLNEKQLESIVLREDELQPSKITA